MGEKICGCIKCKIFEVGSFKIPFQHFVYTKFKTTAAQSLLFPSIVSNSGHSLHTVFTQHTHSNTHTQHAAHTHTHARTHSLSDTDAASSHTHTRTRTRTHTRKLLRKRCSCRYGVFSINPWIKIFCLHEM